MIEHLDRIERLGFTINLNWNKAIDIIYQLSNDSINNLSQWPTDIRILYCSYRTDSELSFENIVETVCDFFYMWYNKNLDVIKDYEMTSWEPNFDRFVESGLGDITQQVYRDFNIENLLNK